jgi:hypothetical protein
MKPSGRYILIALASLIVAGLLHFWLAPLATRVPKDYAAQLQFDVEDRFRPSLEEAWQTNTFIGLRTDQTLTKTESAVIVQADLVWSTEAGELIFENTGLYAVDRRSREILPGYGDNERTGNYLFPPHLQQTTYTFWDPMFIGQRSATFDRLEFVDGLKTYVFSFTGEDMDETAGYSYLAGVPEKYLTHTDGKGTFWVEPLSGTIVDYEEQGVSYFVDPASGTPLPEAEFHIWNDRYTPESKTAQIKLARVSRLHIQLVETWLPIFILLTGLIWIAIGLITKSLKIKRLQENK